MGTNAVDVMRSTHVVYPIEVGCDGEGRSRHSWLNSQLLKFVNENTRRRPGQPPFGKHVCTGKQRTDRFPGPPSDGMSYTSN